jgi:REP element-mobilizing transposase RayT
MRIPRTIQLYPPSGYVHQYWRCHNKEHYLTAAAVKNVYFECIRKALVKRITNDSVKIHSFCAMDNHFHQVMSYDDDSKWLSKFMRQSHGLFGAKYNRQHGRSGKVAEGRPKTPLIENTEHLMQVHFYVEANPIRAGKMSLVQLKNYKYSSYGFYAFGKKSEFTNLLTIPQWYIDLGKTALERQTKYQKLFRQYLDTNGFRPIGFMGIFIGSPTWVIEQKAKAKFNLSQRIIIPKPTDSICMDTG